MVKPVCCRDTTGSKACRQYVPEAYTVAVHPVHIQADAEIKSGKHELSYPCVSKCLPNTQLCYFFFIQTSLSATSKV